MNSSTTECRRKPTTERKATAISTSFRRCATQALSKRSAISPPIADRKKNGAMNTVPVSAINIPLCGPASSYSSRKTSAFFRKLSLNAEKNWHQNSGAKRRVNIKGSMALALRS